MFGYIIYLVEQTWSGLSVPYCSTLGKQACRYSEEPYNAAMPRELVWIDQPCFRGWGRSQCAWISQTRFRAELILERAVFDRQDSRTGQCFRAPSFGLDVEHYWDFSPSDLGKVSG